MRIKTWHIVVIVIVLLIIAAPFASGFLFKRSYFNFIAALESDKTMKISILEYHQGWLSSNAKILIKVNHHESFPDSPSSAFNPFFDIILDEHISHGPFVHDPIQKKWTLAEAIVQSRFHLPESIESMLLGENAHEGALQINILATFFNQYIVDVKTPIFSTEIPGVGKFVWQGLQGNMQMEIQGEHIKHIQSNLNIGGFSGQARDVSVTTQGMTFKADAVRHPIGLLDSSSSMTISDFVFTAPNAGMYSLKNLHFSYLTDVTSQFYNTQTQISLEHFITPQFSIDPSNVKIVVNHLNASGLIDLRDALEALNPDQVSREQYHQVFLTKIPQLITPTTLATENILFKTGDGQLLSDGQIAWPVVVKTIPEMINQANFKVNVRLAISLMKKLIELDQQYYPKHDESNAAVQSTLSTEHSTSTTSTPPVPLATTQLIPVLSDQMMSTSQTNSSQNLQPGLTQDKVEAWIKAGYLVIDKDDYVTTLTYDHGVLKANGHEVS